MQIDSKSPIFKKRAQKYNQKGFSLLELMISMVIFLIVTGAVYGVLVVAQRSRTVVNQQSQLNKSVRIALSLIGRDTYNAGYGYPLNSTVILPDKRISTLLGIPDDVDPSRDTVPPIIAGNNINLNTLSSSSGVLTDQVTFLFKDSTFNLVGAVGSEESQPLNINAATTSTGGIDEIVPISGSNSACQKNDLYLITGNTGSALALATALSGTNKVQFSNGDVLGINQTGTSGPLRTISIPATLLRVRMITFFVTSDGILIRREYANVPPVGANPPVNWVDQPLVYGVEDFQIQYILDDGSLSSNPSAGVDGIPGNADDIQTNLMKIRQVRFTINVRGTEANASNQPYRISMSSTFSTRNLGYEAN